MNKSQFKDPVSGIYIAGAVVVSRSLTQEVAGSSPFTVMTNIFCHLNLLNSVKTFRENSNGLNSTERREATKCLCKSHTHQ